MTNEKPRFRADVAVLGGGFAGVYGAKELTRGLKKLGLRGRRVVLVSEDNHMVFQPMLPEVAGSALSPRHVVNPIRRMCPGAEVFNGEIVRIDPAAKELTLRAGPFVGEIVLQFESLLVALGSSIDLSRIPGMQEHAFLIQNVGDAMRLRAAVLGRFEEANLALDPELRRRLLSFVFVGGGYSGAETAGQILDFCRAICRQYGSIVFSECSFTLVHSGAHLLPTAHESLGRYTERKLKERGLTIELGCRVEAVTASKVHLSSKETLSASTVVCAVGNAPHPLLKELGARLDRGRIAVEPDGSAPGIPWLWAAGDCSAFPHPDGGICASTAQFAMRQGKLAGANIARRMAGRETRAFAFRGLGELAAVGHHTAVAEIKGLRFSGFVAWWMWRTIYLSKLPGLDRKLRVAANWTLELFFPRDTTILNPRYSSGFSETYLTPGDTLFQSGDPAFSFYIVKQGCVELRENGRLVRAIGAGEHFGERALLDDGFFKFDAVAAMPTVLLNITRAMFEKVFAADAEFATRLRRSAASYLSSDELAAITAKLPAETLARPVRELMTTDVFAFNRLQPIGDALAAVKARGKNYIPVIDDDGALLGVVVKESLYRAVHLGGTSPSDPIETLPLEELPTVRPDDTVETCVRAMARRGSTKALALDERRRPIGVFSLIDVFAHVEPSLIK